MHGLIHARRLPDRAELFTPVEEKILDDNTMWDNLLEQWPQLDPSVSPIDRLYSFQVPLSQELKAKLRKMAVRVEIHPDHPVSKGNNPTGGFYARLQAHGLGMNLQRTAFWRDSNHWLQ